MVRRLKYHEKKLLKKVNFMKWDCDNPNEAKVIRKYYLTGREEYSNYIKIVAAVRAVVKKILNLDPADPNRHEFQDVLTTKLYDSGLIINRKLSECEHLSVSSICRRRLPVMLLKLKMAPRVQDATRMVEHGHIRIGPNVITDPAYLVTRSMEDFITWTDTSKIKRHVLEYTEQLDDFEIEN
ncbi:U3 small nucleolar ribonucleoprotein IMP3 [Thelohanellus kitauei]|uniref:U3 small nucleolar ribonucleoprotein protein IMP3 n=1 Tax=Thelohanellus kitauei TaxID=669202 RepID=A0A0C2MTG2_THEKT|nr:U3 small nucleolar ribonucleoprotein IMP3 [Thelohanellus kitauei]